MESGLTTGDLALMDRDGWGGNSIMWIFALLILAGGGFGGYGRGDYGQYASAASQQEILFGQQFQNLDNKLDRLGNGIADATFAINNSIKDGNSMVAGRVVDEGRALQNQLAEHNCMVQRNVDSLRFDMSNYAAQIQASATANTQKVLDAISQSKIDTLQAQVNKLQLDQAMCGVVRYPNQWAYNAGPSPFCNCGGCNCGNI